MDDNSTLASVPDEWLDILAESEAELAAGLTVSGDQILRELYEAAEQLEAAQAEEQSGRAARPR